MLKLLIKNRLVSLLSVFSGKRKSSGKKGIAANYAVMAVLYALIIAMFAFVATTMSISLAIALIPLDAAWLYFSIFILAAVSVLFIFSIFETKAELFDCKDNELILSMPIKPRDIVAARISTVLIYNYFVEAIIMLPAIIVYFVFSKDFLRTAGAVVISLFLPLLATALSAGVGYVVAIISKKLKNNSFIVLFISIAFLVAYFLGYGKLVEGMDSIFEAEGESLVLSAEKVPFLYFLGKSVAFSPLEFISVLSVCVTLALIAYYIISKTYFNIITKTQNSRKAVYSGEGSVKRSAVYALTVKELRRFASSATYMLNGALGFLFLIVASVAAAVKKDELLSFSSIFAEGISASSNDILSLLFVSVSALISAMAMISASALSLEGKNLWIPKTLPVTDREILLSKTLPQIIVSLPFTLVSSIVFAIAFSLPIKYVPFVILTPVITNILFAFIGSIINLLFPKFDYENEAQVIKQSLTAFLVLLIQTVISLGVIALSVAFIIIGLSYAAHIIIFAVLFLLSILAAVLLLGPLSKKYSKIEV